MASHQFASPDLFDTQIGPFGFAYAPNMVSAADETELVAQIAALPLSEFRFQGFLAKRRVVYFGWRYDFDNSRFEPTIPIPQCFVELRSRAAKFAQLTPDALPHALVTEYSPGAEIGWHRDRPCSRMSLEFP